jgi:hypothetical protein
MGQAINKWHPDRRLSFAQDRRPELAISPLEAVRKAAEPGISDRRKELTIVIFLKAMNEQKGERKLNRVPLSDTGAS